ncbi:MAG TPA: MnhB domain-containing protein [Solirubrobacterales bacterium]|nr:MnhB domain-containing protein [Solirubrobacterales bacterium]
MRRSARLGLFGAGAAALATMLVLAIAGLPGFGRYPGPYGDAIEAVGESKTHATDLVTAVNFDFRAYDTLGEEFILFAAVLGIAIVLRDRRGERKRAPGAPGTERGLARPSAALGMVGLALVGPLVVLGIDIAVHGHLTPGGGFQGGLPLGAAVFLAFLAGEYAAMKKVAPHATVELGEAAGAAGYALIGLGGLLFAGVFFQNFIDRGEPGRLLSAGTIPLSNVAVALEVAGAFLLLWNEFSDQALLVVPEGEQGER